jgi:integrase
MTKKRSARGKGQLFYREGLGWYGRWWALVEGERVRITRALHTDNKAVARAKLVKLMAGGKTTAAEARRGESFEEAARRLVEEQKANGHVTWKDRLQRYVTYVFPRIGRLDPSEVSKKHVRGVLKSAAELGKSRETIIHLKTDVSVVLEDLFQDELIDKNVCARLVIPAVKAEVAERSKKERAVLTDDELVRYLAWQHPDEQHQLATLERQVMACVARCFGGLRTGDLHAVRWEHFGAGNGFETGTAPRRKGRGLSKGAKPQQLTIPALLRPILDDWWQRHGRPAAGLVFPKLRGADAGKAPRKSTSHAKAFRDDLRRAFGIDALQQIVTVRSNGRKLTRQAWQQGRELTERERILFTETELTLPADWHSWRRAFNQALADAGVNAQTAKLLAGHATTEAHERYLQNTQKIRTIPVEALPNIGHKALGTFCESSQIFAATGTDDLSGTPQKLAETATIAPLGAGCWRFKSSHPDPTSCSDAR